MTIITGRKRSRQHQWFKDNKWLDYDLEKDSVTCFYCKKHENKKYLELEKNKNTEFNNWKKATQKFQEHKIVQQSVMS